MLLSITGLLDLKVAPNWCKNEISDDTVVKIIEAIDMDHSGDICTDEFEVWMEISVSRPKLLLIVTKIVLGLGQVMSKQPETMKQSYPGPQWDWERLKTFSLDFNWVVPICEINYVQSFCFNVFAYPCVAYFLVRSTWAMNDRQEKKSKEKRILSAFFFLWKNAQKNAEAGQNTLTRHGSRENIHGDIVPVLVPVLADCASSAENYEAQAAKRRDYYFAFFLCYPTLTQTFFQHFNCRQLPDKDVLQADYDIVCWDFGHESGGGKQWWYLAIVSFFGLIVVSFGFPLYMWWRMRKEWLAQISEHRLIHKRHIVAVRDFSRKFDYINGDFRPEAYHAEPLDLLRKLVLTGLMSWIHKGTVFQSFVSVVASLFFMVCHIKLWPYPYPGANVLKLFADLQIMLLAVVGLILRIDESTMKTEKYGREFRVSTVRKSGLDTSAHGASSGVQDPDGANAAKPSGSRDRGSNA
eukprot:SAG22_NODE_516_length_9563_cov_29.476965_2_plen_466_part_00